MNYPLISEYISSILSAEDNFDQLSYLRPVLNEDSSPVMTSGNFAVVFKMQDSRNGKLHALKCFTKEQPGRAEAYKLIAEELSKVSSPYLTSVQYLDNELFVDSKQTDETEFPVLLMDWVEGEKLDKYLLENLSDHYALEMLAYRFSELIQWLLPKPFAHGDLKPDNILVSEEGSIVLVDYDGMYVPAMKGQKSRELGSPEYRHPSHTEYDFDEHIDDFPAISILLSLAAIAHNSLKFFHHGNRDLLVFRENDYRNLGESLAVQKILTSDNTMLCTLLGLFLIVNANKVLPIYAIIYFRYSAPIRDCHISSFIVNSEMAQILEALRNDSCDVNNSEAVRMIDVFRGIQKKDLKDRYLRYRNAIFFPPAERIEAGDLIKLYATTKGNIIYEITKP